ncbi:MAG TPA: hypothetical protein VGF94_02885 [Kofleriaceae bacterium]|jgi:hypothetical protein
MSRTPVIVLAAALASAGAARADNYVVNRVVAKLPTISLAKRDASPHVIDLQVGQVFTPREVDRFCGARSIKLVPIAHLDVRSPAEWHFTTDDPQLELYAQTREGCFEQLDTKTLPDGHYLLWGRAPASYARASFTLHVEISQPPRPAATQLAVDELAHAVVATVAIPPGRARWMPLELTSSARHDLRIYVFGPGTRAGVGLEATGMPQPAFDVAIHPGEPLSVDVYGDGGTQLTVVVTERDKTAATARDIYGAPAAGASIDDRALAKHSFIGTGRFGVSLDSAELARDLFTTIDPAFVVYGTAERPECRLHAGEPVLLVHHSTILHANGDLEDCSFRAGEPARDFLTATRPAHLALPPVLALQSDEHERIWADESFLARADRDKGIAAYKAVKATASACYEREWSRLDPDHKADNYDIVSYQNGKVSKVESYGDRIFRKVHAACHLENLEKQRAAIYARLAKSFQAEEQARLDEIAKRLAALT